MDWLYNVEVESSERAVVIGRGKPDTWPEHSDPLTLPVSRFETTDGGRTFSARGKAAITVESVTSRVAQRQPSPVETGYCWHRSRHTLWNTQWP